MSHTLISFLGKARKQDGGQYRTAHYQFPDGSQQTHQFFGLGLAQVIQPDRLIILGTSGSMWDVFYENFAPADQEEHWLQLAEAVENDRVTQALLNSCAEDLNRQCDMEYRLKLIPYGIDEIQQTAILQTMAEDVQPQDQVTLDLTHGLRHLPMLGLLSAMYLQAAKQVTIQNIYYGAMELTRNEMTPVMSLKGLLKIADWVSVLHGFDKTGDIAPFADLLVQEGVAKETAQLLQTAGFYENNLDITKARNPLKKFTDQTREGLPGIASLFNDSLNSRLQWIKGDNIYLRQREKAQFYLEQGDYLRASALGFEALISWYIKQNQPSADAENYDLRQNAKEALEDQIKMDSKAKWQDYKTFKGIRNSMAHANRSDVKEVQILLQDEAKLKTKLQQLFNTLLPTTMN